MPRIIRNPAFDKRRYPFGAVDSKGNFKASGGSNMYRGRLETSATKGFGPRSTIYQLYFMYNPTALTHGSSVDPAYNPATLFNEGSGNFGADPSPFMQLGSTISFQLLFDRTYETWHQNGSYLANWGVMADVKVLYAMLGMYELQYDQQGKFLGADADPNVLQNITPSSVHVFTPMWAIFGPKLKYYGALSNFNLTYTHFTQNMVPNRATVEVSFNLLPKGGMEKSAATIAKEASKKTKKGTGYRPYKPGEVGP